MSARIATIIPTFCRRVLLQRAVESVIDQGVEVDIRIFDNASSDDTEAVVSRLAINDPRVSYHRHSENLGGAANFEFGLSTVDTDFFSILSDDDYLLPGFYEQAIAALDADPLAMFWAGCTLHVDESDVVVEARVETWPRQGRFEGEEGVMAMTHGRAPTWTGIVFRRAVLEQLGPPDREARGPSDLDFVLRAAARWPFVISFHPSAVFTLNSTSFSATQPLSSFWPGWIRMIDNVRGWPTLDAGARERLALALEEDARRMLFRRGVHALVVERRDFASDAAHALRGVPGGRVAGCVLEIGLAAGRISFVQRVIERVYRLLERRIMQGRADLQRRHASLLRASRVP